MYNRCVKINKKKFPTGWERWHKASEGYFLTHTVYCVGWGVKL